MDKWNGDRRKVIACISKTATKSTLRPGDYPIGSFKSRAAARAKIRPVKTIDEERSLKVCKTLSNDELDALLTYVMLLQNKRKGEPTPEQLAALDTYLQRINEIRTTGKLAANPWGALQVS